MSRWATTGLTPPTSPSLWSNAVSPGRVQRQGQGRRHPGHHCRAARRARATKGLGVSIRQSEVNDWIKDNAKAVEGLSEGQQNVAATLAILEQKSKDAWAAYQQGGSTAEQTLDTFRASIANLKDSVVLGLGGVLEEIIGDLSGGGALDGLTSSLDKIPQWINDNQSTVKSFFIDLGALHPVRRRRCTVLHADDADGVHRDVSCDLWLRVALRQHHRGDHGGDGALLPCDRSGQARRLHSENKDAMLAFKDSANDTANEFIQNVAPSIEAGLQEGRDQIGSMKDASPGLKDTTLHIKVKAEREGISAADRTSRTSTPGQAIDLAVDRPQERERSGARGLA